MEGAARGRGRNRVNGVVVSDAMVVVVDIKMLRVREDCPYNSRRHCHHEDSCDRSPEQNVSNRQQHQKTTR